MSFGDMRESKCCGRMKELVSRRRRQASVVLGMQERGRHLCRMKKQERKEEAGIHIGASRKGAKLYVEKRNRKCYRDVAKARKLSKEENG